VQIIDFPTDDEETIRQVARLLVEGFREHWPSAWPDIDSALREVRESFRPDRISRIATDDDGTVLGWIGAIREYRGDAWELHPLVVDADHQRRGIGRALVADLESQVSRRGGITIFLGTDDEDNMTSLAKVDLYPDVFQHIANIKNVRGHPYEFYQRLGYVIVGVIPDANGLGKPDIIMAKRLAAC
jgi:aminoglycoside 6'-N-acetyltransferase I